MRLFAADGFAMNDLQTLSGPWSGFWIQAQMRGYMKLRLQFIGNQILGGGSDCAGWFEISGKLQPETGQVHFAKRYPGYIVEYAGRWDGQLISGLWTMRHPVTHPYPHFVEEKGEFEMWPESDDEESIGDILQENREAALTN